MRSNRWVPLLAAAIWVLSLPASAEPPDERAELVAERLLEASGGAAGWDATRFVSWYSISGRLLVWDRTTDDVRVENEMTVILMNLGSGEGRAWKYGEEITEADELERALAFGYDAFRRDARALLLPFLLGEEGVTLIYDGVGEIDGQPVDRLRVRFAGEARSPAAEIRIHVDRQTGLIRRWESYIEVGDAEPAYSVPWSNYADYGTIRLSDERGLKRHTDLHVFDELPRRVFESPEPVPWVGGKRASPDGDRDDS